MSSITEFPMPAWATERAVSREGVHDWSHRVALLPAVTTYGQRDVYVEVRHSSPNDEDGAPGPFVSTTAGIDTFDIAPNDARKLAAALIEAADLLDAEVVVAP